MGSSGVFDKSRSERGAPGPVRRRARARVAAAAAVAAVATAAVGAAVLGRPARTEAQDDAAATPASSTRSERVGPRRVVLRTDHGDLVLALFPDAAPRHVEQLLRLVSLGVYDGVRIARLEHRVSIEIGDARRQRAVPLTAEQEAAIDRLPLEPGVPHRKDGLTMVRPDDDRDGAETAFAILLEDAPHRNGDYTVFGRVEAGLDVLDEIAVLPRMADGRPGRPLPIRRAFVADAGELAAMRARGALRLSPTTDAHRLRFVIAIGLLIASGALLHLGPTRLRPKTLAHLGLVVVVVGLVVLLVGLAQQTLVAPGDLAAVGVIVVFLVALAVASRRSRSGEGRRALGSQDVGPS